MKYVLAFLQFVLFLLLFFVGSVILPAFGLLPNMTVAVGDHRIFTYDGIVLALVVFLLLLGVEAARKTIRTSGGRTSAAFVLAIVLGLLMKFGLKTF